VLAHAPPGPRHPLHQVGHVQPQHHGPALLQETGTHAASAHDADDDADDANDANANAAA